MSSTRSKEAVGMVHHLGRGARCGALVGALAGLAEVFFRGFDNASVITRHFLVPAMLAYALVWACGGVCLGVGRGILKRGQPLNARDTAWYLTALLSSALLILVGGYVNFYWLPFFMSARSLLFDAVLILGIALCARVVGYPLLIRLLVRLQRSGGRVRNVGRLGLATLVIGAVLVTYVPTPASQAVPGTVASAVRIPCNVVLIVMDATRADHLSVYGYPRNTAPTLERLAKRGVLFRKAMANASWTCPSVPTLLTALYPSTHQVTRVASGLHPSIPTLAQLLRQRGMRTAIFTGNPFVSPLSGFDRGVERFVYSQPSLTSQYILGHVLMKLLLPVPRLRKMVKDAMTRFDRLVHSQAAATTQDASAAALNRAFLSWVKQIYPQRFFAYLHYLEPHAPYEPPEPYRQLFVSGSEAKRSGAIEQLRAKLPFESGRSVSPEERQRLIELYDAEIRSLDAAIDEVLEGLKQLGVEETAVIVTADHGEEFFEHGGWGHGQSLYQELLHVPLILSYPARLPKEQVVDVAVSHIDVMPTILELCGGAEPDLYLEGTSLLSFLEGTPTRREDRPVYSELDLGGASARALMRGRYKLIVSKEGPRRQVALYDLEQDPAETHDLSGQRPDVTASLLEELEATTRRASERSRGRVAAKLDAATSDQLRALGYLQ